MTTSSGDDRTPCRRNTVSAAGKAARIEGAAGVAVPHAVECVIAGGEGTEKIEIGPSHAGDAIA